MPGRAENMFNQPFPKGITFAPEPEII